MVKLWELENLLFLSGFSLGRRGCFRLKFVLLVTVINYLPATYSTNQKRIDRREKLRDLRFFRAADGSWFICS
jgi:hypothetical protein